MCVGCACARVRYVLGVGREGGVGVGCVLGGGREGGVGVGCVLGGGREGGVCVGCAGVCICVCVGCLLGVRVLSQHAACHCEK